MYKSLLYKNNCSSLIVLAFEYYIIAHLSYYVLFCLLLMTSGVFSQTQFLLNYFSNSRFNICGARICTLSSRVQTYGMSV